MLEYTVQVYTLAYTHISEWQKMSAENKHTHAENKVINKC